MLPGCSQGHSLWPPDGQRQLGSPAAKQFVVAPPDDATSDVLAPRLVHVFNVQGSEMIFLLLIALVVLGPEKLPEAVRKFTKTYAEFKKTVGGFQNEFRDAMDEPMRELRETANLVRDAAKFDLNGDDADAMDKLTPPASEPTSSVNV